ncbi:MAG: hypothetical protein FJZ58_01195 [Chlamydiae bacterium]|nr:hypothetical protein [Chlamydiota bacterium]
MKLSHMAICILGWIGGSQCFLHAESSVSQVLKMIINATSNLTVSGNPGTLTVSLNSAGVGSATDATTTYAITSNTGGNGRLKITGAISSGGNMPTNTSLTVALASTSGTSQGAQALSTSPVDLVTNLPTLVSDTGGITYTFGVTNGWTVPAQTLNRTVTLTITSSS